MPSTGSCIKHEVEQKSAEWLALRKKFITATDAAKLVMMITKGSFEYSTLTEWHEDKMSTTSDKAGKFKRKNMAMGELSEASIVAKSFTGEKYELSGVYSRDIFLASLDVRRKADNAILELKYCVAGPQGKQYNLFTSRKHHAFYQLAAQMYVMGSEEGAILVTAHGEGDMPKKHEQLLTMDVNSEEYKTFVECIPKLKQIYESSIIKREHPVIVRERAEGDQGVQALSEKLASIEEEIRVLSEKKSILKDRIMDSVSKGADSKFYDSTGIAKQWRVISSVVKRKIYSPDTPEEYIAYEESTRDTLKLLKIKTEEEKGK